MSLNDLRPERMRSITAPKKAFNEEFEFGWKAGNQFQVLDEADCLDTSSCEIRPFDSHKMSQMDNEDNNKYNLI